MRKIVFLSRASGEFKELTNTIRAEGARAFPMLDIHDQEAPPQVALKGSGGAEKTIEKLFAWISCSEVILHYVGEHSGAQAKAPVDERVPSDELAKLKGLLRLLDPASQTALDLLLTAFSEAGLPHSSLTYTQVEGIMALALKKAPLIFMLEPLASGGSSPSQNVYRDWLKKHALEGLDRVYAQRTESLILATYRKLGELNKNTLLEQLTRSSQEQPLWETAFLLNQPEADAVHNLQRWAGIRQFTGSTKVDWIETSVPGGDAPPPGWLDLVLPEDEAADEMWLLRYPGTAVIIFRDPTNGWTRRETGVDGSTIRAVCHHGGDVWVLAETNKKYFIHCLGPVSDASATEVVDFFRHDFEGVHLWHADGCFHLACASSHGSLRFSGGVCLLQEESAKAVGRSMVTPQFAKRLGFPFRRHFNGGTYEAWQRGQRRAVVNHQERVCHVTFKEGLFQDAFRTVDVKLEGCWKSQDLVMQGDVLTLKVQHPEDPGRLHHLPLFPAALNESWVNPTTQTGLFLLNDPGFQSHEIRPARDAAFTPFCFVGRRFDRTEETTHYQVWLLPPSPQKELIQRLAGFLCGIEPLPAAPVQGDGRDWAGKISALSGWWKYLWENCRM